MDANAGRTPLRILIVADPRDHFDTASVLPRLLRIGGDDVSVVASLARCDPLCSRRDFDVLLCDIGLDDRRGIEIPSQLKRDHPVTKLIALSGYVMPDDLKQIAGGGFDAVLSKPFHFDDLQRILAPPEGRGAPRASRAPRRPRPRPAIVRRISTHRAGTTTT